MKKYALLLGSAPEDFRQKKIEDMFDFLDSKRSAGDSIVTFANGISELMLETVLDNAMRQLTNVGHSELADFRCRPHSDSESAKQTLNQVQGDGVCKSNSILLYICTLQPVGDGEKSIWLGGEEIRKDVILHYQELAKDCGIDMQVVMDWDSEMMSEEEAGWERVEDSHFELQTCHSELDSESTKEMLNQVQHDNNLRPSAESAGDRN